MVGEVGFVGKVTYQLRWGTVALTLLFALEQGINWLRSRNRRLYLRASGLHVSVAVGALVMMGLLLLTDPEAGAYNKVSLLFYVAVQGAIFCSLSLRALKHQARLTALRIRPGWLLIGSFALIIGIGTLLLKLPRAIAAGEHFSWLDALFTSTSAVCVTGLAVENTAHFFTPTGQIILLALIQIGGLGIMTITFYLSTMLFHGMSMYDRQCLGEMISEKHLAHVSHALRFIILFTLSSELLGAVWIYGALPSDHGVTERAFQAVFHSISAFCNAGFSTLPDGLADSWVRGNVSLQACISLLIILGGMGSLVIRDLLLWFQARFQRLQNPASPRVRLRVHTRLVLTVTLILLVGGALAMGVSEYLLFKGQENGGRWITAWFFSATARTAGFNTVDMGGIGPVTAQILILLMLIGGSPGGTAGGMRTTVFAVAALHLWNQLRMFPQLILFRRRLPDMLGPRALVVLVLTTAWLFVNLAILRQLEPRVEGASLIFELVSAFATVGLSLNLTPELSDGAKGLLIVNMFVGRIGLMTLLTSLVPATRRRPLQYPTEDILLL